MSADGRLEICFVTQCLSSITLWAGGLALSRSPIGIEANKSERAAAYTVARARPSSLQHIGFAQHWLLGPLSQVCLYIHNSPKNHHITSPPVTPLFPPSAVQTVQLCVCVCWARRQISALYTGICVWSKEDRRTASKKRERLKTKKNSFYGARRLQFVCVRVFVEDFDQCQ